MNKINGLQSKIQKICITISVIFIVSVFFLISCSKPKVYRVGVLSGLNFFAEITDGFKARMTELEYIEGKKENKNQKKVFWNGEIKRHRTTFSLNQWGHI